MELPKRKPNRLASYDYNGEGAYFITICTQNRKCLLSRIVPRFVSTRKRFCRRDMNEKIFQRSYHDHIVRNQQDYLKIWEYIDNNPKQWELDCFYCKEE